MTDALIFLAPGYEEVEMLTVVDMVRRAGLVIDMVSITDTLEVTSSHNVTIKADKLFKEADFDSAKMIILPGGIPGTPNLLAYKPLTDKSWSLKKTVSCFPLFVPHLSLWSAWHLKDHKATCYPGRKLILIVPNISPNLLLLTDSSRQAVAWVPALNLQELLSHA